MTQGSPLALLAVVIGLGGPALAQTSTTLPRADGAPLPVRIHAPADGSTCPPVMLVSHGFGGSEAGLAGLAEAVAAQGWRVIVMGHRESGREQLRQAFQQGGGLAGVDAGARDRSRHVARFADLDAAIAAATRACKPSLLVLAGHSMGAQTTMMEAGARALIGAMGRNRFDGYVALSPQGIGTTFAAGAWAAVSKPVLMVTGTQDHVVGGDYMARLSAFEGLPPGNKRLAVIAGAGHLQIGGIGSASVSATVNGLVIAFLEQLSSGRPMPAQIKGARITDK